MNITRRALPYLFGAGVLIVAMMIGPSLSPKNGAKPHGTAQRPRPTRDVTQEAPQALYLLIAQGMVTKLNGDEALLTVRESGELTRAVSKRLQEELGLELPPGFELPADIPLDWMRQPTFLNMDHYDFARRLGETNATYIDQLIARMLDEYGARTVPKVSACLREITAARKPADGVSISFLKTLYGDNFVSECAKAARHLQSAEPPKRPQVLPEAIIASAESKAGGLWRTEFTDDEFISLRDFLIRRDIVEKIRTDLLYNNLPAAERELLGKDIMGHRLLTLHDITRQTVMATCLRPSDGPTSETPANTKLKYAP